MTSKPKMIDGSKRSLFKTALTALAAGALSRTFVGDVVGAEEAQKVTESDPTAKAIGYVEDASKADTAKFPKRAGADGASQFCKNCQLYTGEGSGYGPCAIFGGKLVNAGGWCNSWMKKSG